jgi:2-C-methyl-D-erythritol 4-phosphate cytidylyltransferase/2-C-methyl-D-erythritol 2,4-cyclodiphosphate synthase
VTRYRVGTGIDVHRFAPGRPLMLAGVLVPHDRGLAGHSDGDCAIHALCDALLGALAAGDMGTHFPSSDPQWKDAASARFLEQVVRLVGERGWAVQNVDLTILAEAPRLAPHTREMRAEVSRLLGVPLDAVSVKAKSADGTGAVGGGEAIVALATVLLERSR